MSGQDLYTQLSKRDYSGSPEDEYAQLLQTIYFHCTVSGEMQGFFDLLEKADAEDKKLSLPEDADEYSISSVVLA